MRGGNHRLTQIIAQVLSNKIRVIRENNQWFSVVKQQSIFRRVSGKAPGVL
jgi:hypothetical protein